MTEISASRRIDRAAVLARAALRASAAWLARCHARAEQRRALAALDARLLKDVGIAPPAADAESAKPWWRA